MQRAAGFQYSAVQTATLAASAELATGVAGATDDAAGAASGPSSDAEKFHWTPGKICLSLTLFVVAGFAEIGGGWLVWQSIR